MICRKLQRLERSSPETSLGSTQIRSVLSSLLTLKPSSSHCNETSSSTNYELFVLLCELIGRIPNDATSKSEGRLWSDFAIFRNEGLVESSLLKVASPECETVCRFRR